MSGSVFALDYAVIALRKFQPFPKVCARAADMPETRL